MKKLSDVLKEQYGEKLYKISLSSGCTCPNRDGTAGFGGCAFCSEGGSGEFAAKAEDIDEQIEEAKKRIRSKTDAKRFIAYFQAFTNTYGDIGRLTGLYESVIRREDIAILSVGTRPDCLGEPVMKMLRGLNGIKPVWVELGLQTMHEDTARRLNRGYPLAVFEDGCRRLKEAGLQVVVHVIFGLPGETKEDMLDTIRYLGTLEPRPDGIKLQMLNILKGTRLGAEYEKEPFPLLSLQEYAELVAESIRILPEDMVIHRMTGDGPGDLLTAPEWVRNKKKVLNTINRLTNRSIEMGGNRMHPYHAEKWRKQIETVIAQGPYTDTWESLMRHETPRWFRDAKFGIFIHWGVYSVPAFENEWYPRSMYIRGSRANRHHLETYGSLEDFGYKDFIPDFKAEKFNPEEWCALFKQAGARYVVPVAEHHDGFMMYESELSGWNAAKMGPHRDITGELTKAVRNAGMINGASTHRIEHWFFLDHGRDYASDVAAHADERTHLYWPSVRVPDELVIGANNVQPQPSEEFLEDWMFRTIEIIERFQPKELYFDWWIMQKAARPYLRKIAAYYYNRAVSWGEEVLLINKMGAFMYGTATRDMERGQLETVQPDPWQTDTATAKNSWCYTPENVYKKASGIVQDLADAVAKNGCMLLNIGPKADGTIAEEDVRILSEIGNWLRINGEAIYGSRPFMIAQEGPAKPKTGAFTDAQDNSYTSRDFRFTINRGNLYAIALRSDERGSYVIETLADRGKETTQSDINAIVAGVETPDQNIRIRSWKQTGKGLEIITEPVSEEKPDADMPVVFRILME